MSTGGTGGRPGVGSSLAQATVAVTQACSVGLVALRQQPQRQDSVPQGASSSPGGPSCPKVDSCGQTGSLRFILKINVEVCATRTKSDSHQKRLGTSGTVAWHWDHLGGAPHAELMALTWTHCQEGWVLQTAHVLMQDQLLIEALQGLFKLAVQRHRHNTVVCLQAGGTWRGGSAVGRCRYRAAIWLPVSRRSPRQASCGAKRCTQMQVAVFW